MLPVDTQTVLRGQRTSSGPTGSDCGICAMHVWPADGAKSPQHGNHTQRNEGNPNTSEVSLTSQWQDGHQLCLDRSPEEVTVYYVRTVIKKCVHVVCYKVIVVCWKYHNTIFCERFRVLTIIIALKK